LNCLVVIAHPLEDSFCHYLAGEVINHLTAKGYVITVKDLYKENCAPVLSATERAGYYAEQFDARLLKDDIIQLQEAESLVFIFPTWWFSFPAGIPVFFAGGFVFASNGFTTPLNFNTITEFHRLSLSFTANSSQDTESGSTTIRPASDKPTTGKPRSRWAGMQVHAGLREDFPHYVRRRARNLV